MSTLREIGEKMVRRLPAKLQPMARWRFIKFGMVGASGTVINIAVLFMAQEFFLKHIEDFATRLNYAIAMAITVATISNFYWNRRLTWRDRKHVVSQSASVLFLKYVMAAAVSIAIQSLLTKWLAAYFHYLLANLLAIALASGVNFLANDRLTFSRNSSNKKP